MRIKDTNGANAFKRFLSVKFAWGTDPKNPHVKGTPDYCKWERDYFQESVKFFST